MEPLLGAFIVFCMRVVDMSLDTVRLIMTVRGRRLMAGGIGVIQALVFILAVSAVLKGPLTAWNVAGYALGFGTGVMLGMFFEERLAIGFNLFRIYSPGHGHEIAEALRAAGHAATEFPAYGREGTLIVVHCVVSRRDAPHVRAIIEQNDPAAFVTVEEARPMQRGYFRH
jgi:uncharacterized protein YebE (UPF0316 family)